MSDPARTLIDLLRLRSRGQPDRLAYRFLLDGEQQEACLSYRELDLRARAVGAWLQEQVPGSGRTVLLLFPPGLDFIAAFFGCLYGGMIAVPTYPPYPGRRGRALSRLEGIVADAAPAAVLTTSGLLPAVGPLWERLEPGQRPPLLAADRLDEAAGCRWACPEVAADAPAMIQYTSGSTGTPNGVVLSHANLLHNLEQIRDRFGHTEDSRGLIWLPPYHDMGLIGGILEPLYAGFPVTLLSPLHFLQQPVRWLRAVTRTRATTSGGPNFAYELCVERVAPEERAELDLGSWEVAFTGAEPVRARTLERFAASFGPCGFRREAFYPCYGLAEATLMVSGGRREAPPVLCEPEPARGGQPLVGCGSAVAGQEIAIVDPEKMIRCRPGEVGEVWVRGPGVARGYWGRAEGTQRTFGAFVADTGEGPFLRTGDLGFVRDGELFVTGRLKDLIILDGRNLYPQDVEQTVEQSHPALRAGCCAAFSVDGSGAERLVIVAEVERACWSAALRPDGRDGRGWQPVFQAIRRAVSEQHEARAAEVLLVKPATLSKTPSGKLQRHACRAAFLSGSLREASVENQS